MEQNISGLVHSWTRGRFCMRSGFYAGRGPTSSDLNSDILESLYQGIKKELGEAAAANFVRFVNKLDDLSASAFIVAFEQFWAQDCKTVEIEQTSEDRMRLDARGSGLEAQAFGAVMSHMSGGSNKSEDEIRHLSNRLKGKFIWTHRDEIPEDEQQEVEGASFDWVLRS